MIQLENVSKIYHTKYGNIKALDKVNLYVNKGEFVVIRGPSGCGKTTLLLSIGGMLKPTEGKIFISGKNIYDINSRERARFRAENIGFVFQLFHLVPYLNVVENVLLPAGSVKKKYGRTEAERLLKNFELSDRMLHKTTELSTGEKQRTAIARALFNHPSIILADEPTGNLDPENADKIVKYLEEFHKDGGTVVVVTHGKKVDQYADRVIYMRKGKFEKLQ